MELSDAQTREPARILMVDDDPIICAIATDTLTKAGYRVFTVDSGDDAIDAAWDESPDVILLDCGLPGKSGMTLLDEFRASPRFRNIPIAMITARRSEWSENVAKEHGADAYIRKPFDIREMLIEVAKLTKLSVTARQERRKA